MKDREFRAQKFTLVDDQDNLRAVLSVVDGAVALSLADTNRAARMSLIVNQDGEPIVQLCDGDGKPRAAISLSNGHPTVGLHDSAGNERVSLGVTDKDEPIIELRDGGGKRRASLALSFAGEPRLVFSDSSGAPNSSWQSLHAKKERKPLDRT
jgi:hypothetical protein